MPTEIRLRSPFDEFERGLDVLAERAHGVKRDPRHRRGRALPLLIVFKALLDGVPRDLFEMRQVAYPLLETPPMQLLVSALHFDDSKRDVRALGQLAPLQTGGLDGVD